MNMRAEVGTGAAVAAALVGIFGLLAFLLAGMVPDSLGAAADGGALAAGGGLAFWGLAHCDGLDGPVVTLARKALETGNVNLVLPWVRAEDEAEIRTAFERSRAARATGPAAREVADTHFFETLVRVHRAGEGEPFTGLEPAGRDLGPAVPAADRALATGDVEAVVALVGRAVEHSIRERFARAFAARRFDQDDVKAGRDYVAAYVSYVHFVEQLYALAAGGRPHRHAHAAEPVPEAHHAEVGV
jgi:hypothetical protein